MAEKLIKYYQYVSEEKGFSGKVQLATSTKVPSTQAALEPDSPELLKVFKDAVEKITQKPAPEFN